MISNILKETQLNHSSDWIAIVSRNEQQLNLDTNLKSRKLASVQQIESLEPIEGADSIELAKLANLGWEVVVQKGLNQVGDLVVYVEVDSILPATNPEFAFMEPRHYKVKTIKLRGQVSQGIIFPLSIVGENVNYRWWETLLQKVGFLNNLNFQVGDDVTTLLGITKHDPEVEREKSANLGGKHRNWPSFLQKTDEVRVQMLQWLLNKYEGQNFYVTEKLDGSSMTVYLKEIAPGEQKFGVCSRNLELDRPDDDRNAGNAFWQTALKLDLENKLRNYAADCAADNVKNIALQGELVGPGIQGNKYGLKELQFFVYNVFDIDKAEYFSFDSFSFTVNYLLKLTTVPVLDSAYKLPTSVSNLVEYAEGTLSALNNKVLREGVVLRPIVEANERKLGRISLKVINPAFLLKHKE